jgi:hypothetical protein
LEIKLEFKTTKQKIEKKTKQKKIEEGSLSSRSPAALSTTSAHWSPVWDTGSVSGCQVGPTKEKDIFFFLSPAGSTCRRPAPRRQPPSETTALFC